MTSMNEHHYNGQELDITKEMKEQFEQDGFIIVRGLLNAKELAIIEESVKGPDSLTSYAYGNDDGEGREARMCLWNNPGNDVTGALARTRKLAHTAEELLGGEVYHYHSKLMMKDAKSGGKFVWHQDYGYWYNFACLFPDMLTAFIALDRCGKDNGCLQILRGSHRCGRIDHGVVAGQMGADLTRVAELEKQLEKLYVELQPGDALFFHCNVLHTSSSNHSEYRRWAILSCYNRATNSPYEQIMSALYNPLEQIDNGAVEKVKTHKDLGGKEILVKENGQFVVYCK